MELSVVDEIVLQHMEESARIVPILQDVQRHYRYLPEPALRHVAGRLRIPCSRVFAVANFYGAFSLQPRGKHLIRVCLGTACYVRGGKQVLESIKGALGVDVGETTGDGLFSLGVARCFGACGLAPVLTINDDVHQRVKPNKIKDILDQYRMEAAASR